MLSLNHLKFISALSLLSLSMACSNQTGFTSSQKLGQINLMSAPDGKVSTPSDFQIPETDENPAPIPEANPRPSGIPEFDDAPRVIEKNPVCVGTSCTIKTRNVCSDRMSERATTNISESAGVVSKIYSITLTNAPTSGFPKNVYKQVMQSTSDASVLRQKLIDERRFTIDLAGQPAGRYAVILCSSDDSTGKCTLEASGKPEDADSDALREISPNWIQMLLGDVNAHYVIEKKADGSVVKISHQTAMDVILKRNPRASSEKEAELGCDYTISPLVIDTLNPVNSAGVKLTAPSKGLRFDLEGNGSARQISWFLAPEKDCFVALPNAAGKITSGKELFGNKTIGPDGKTSENGFEALKKLDSNKDGVMDSHDSIFPSLRLWCDTTVNGKVDAGELFTLEEKGMKSINLDYFSPVGGDEDIYGNQARQRSSVLSKNGERMIFDIWFRPID